MDDETEFLKSLLGFARWVTLGTGSLGAAACTISFSTGNSTAGFLYLAGTIILMTASTLIAVKRKRLTSSAAAQTRQTAQAE